MDLFAKIKTGFPLLFYFCVALTTKVFQIKISQVYRLLENAPSAGDDHMSIANLNLNDAAGGEAERQREKCIFTSPGIKYAIRKLEQQRPCTSTQEAYEAAATAAWHCDPEAQAVFLGSCKAMLQGSALSLLQSAETHSPRQMCSTSRGTYCLQHRSQLLNESKSSTVL
jgi:hypothetical protein